MNKLLATVLCGLLTNGCASKVAQVREPLVWYKPGAGQTDLHRDLAAARLEAMSYGQPRSRRYYQYGQSAGASVYQGLSNAGDSIASGIASARNEQEAFRLGMMARGWMLIAESELPRLTSPTNQPTSTR